MPDTQTPNTLEDNEIGSPRPLKPPTPKPVPPKIEPTITK